MLVWSEGNGARGQNFWQLNSLTRKRISHLWSRKQMLGLKPWKPVGVVCYFRIPVQKDLACAWLVIKVQLSWQFVLLFQVEIFVETELLASIIGKLGGLLQGVHLTIWSQVARVGILALPRLHCVAHFMVMLGLWFEFQNWSSKLFFWCVCIFHVREAFASHCVNV